jgi:CRP-like cAMP-binding protein
MEELIAYILQFGNLNKQQADLITSKIAQLTLSKDEYLAEAGKMTKYAAFVIEGVLRVCYYNNKGDEITRYFVDENHFAVNWYSFQTGMAASEYVQAVTDCKLLVIAKKDWDELSDIIIEWDSIVNKIIQHNLVQKLRKRSPMIEQDAKTRYLTFLEDFPKVANRVPLSYLASYLGITQSSLSRIRKTLR